MNAAIAARLDLIAREIRGMTPSDDDKKSGKKDKTGKARRGFAAMSPELQRQIARKGGKSVPDEKRSFSRNRELASRAGSKGGRASHTSGGEEQPQGQKPKGPTKGPGSSEEGPGRKPPGSEISAR